MKQQTLIKPDASKTDDERTNELFKKLTTVSVPEFVEYKQLVQQLQVSIMNSHYIYQTKLDQLEEKTVAMDDRIFDTNADVENLKLSLELATLKSRIFLLL